MLLGLELKADMYGIDCSSSYYITLIYIWKHDAYIIFFYINIDNTLQILLVIDLYTISDIKM